MSIKQVWGAALLAAGLFAVVTPAVAADANPDASGASDRGVLLDRIVAVVNDDVILFSELQRETARTRQQMRRQGTPVPSTDALHHQVLEHLISIQLQLQQATQRGIHISDDMLNQALAGIAERNGFTLSEMPTKLAATGIDYKQFRQHVRRQLLLQRIRRQAVDEQITVTPTEVEQYQVKQAKQGHGNAQYHVYQILFKVPGDASGEETDKIYQTASATYEKLENGADFEATAAAISDGRQALKGGDMGWLRGGELPTSLANTVLTMNEDTISEPIKDKEGYHIIKLAGERAEHKVIVTQTHARHILIEPDLLVSNSEAEQRLEDLRKKIENGASFAQLAEKYSDDSGSASKGGDLGWLNPGEVVPEFQKVMDDLPPKQISTPFKTQFGWHIVEVLDRRKQNMTEQSRRRQAYSAIQQRKQREKSERWLHQLRDKAYVHTSLDKGSDADSDTS